MEEVHTSKPRRQWPYILRTLLSSGGVGDWFFPGDLKKKKKKKSGKLFFNKVEGLKKKKKKKKGEQNSIQKALKKRAEFNLKSRMPLKKKKKKKKEQNSIQKAEVWHPCYMDQKHNFTNPTC